MLGFSMAGIAGYFDKDIAAISKGTTKTVQGIVVKKINEKKIYK